MSRAGTLEEFGVSVVIVAVGTGLDGVDDVVLLAVAALPPLGVILSITTTSVTIVTMAVTVVVALVIAAIVAMPIITTIVVASSLKIRVGGSPGGLIEVLIHLICICIRLCNSEQLMDLLWAFAEHLFSESVVVA
jgi:hypothetical protein